MWDWILLLLVVFSSLEVPFVLAFNLPLGARDGIRYFDIVVDVFFWLDIIFTCNTSYYVNEQLVTSRQAILKRYAGGWLFVDVVATVPWDYMTAGTVKVLRLLRLLRLKRVIIKLDSLRGGFILGFFTLLFWWVLIAHWFGCIWWYIGRQGYEEANERWMRGEPPVNETTWLVRIPPTGKGPDFNVTTFKHCVDKCIAVNNCNQGFNCTRMMCMANPLCDDNNLDPNLSVTHDGEVWNHWWTSIYWALTMLTKMPNVGPDTALEKFFSCITVIVGAIFFALLLGQVTTLIMVSIKASAQLRDQLVTLGTFASSRRLPAKLHQTLKSHTSAEWSLTKGMDAQTLLSDFPTQLKGDVLNQIFSGLVECNPPFLRCSEQLRRQILGLLKPGVALKKQTIIAGRQFGATIYILMKGTLQVSQAPSTDGRSTEGEAETTPQNSRRGVSMGSKDLKRALTRANTKGFKDKLKVRMLEKPGAVIPLTSVYYGPQTSPFSVFALTFCQLLTVEAGELARVLESFPVSDASVVTTALDAEFKNITESLKMNRGSRIVDVGQDSSRDSHVGEVASSSDSPAQTRPPQQSTASMTLTEKVDDMEARSKLLIEELNNLQKLTTAVPAVWQALASRFNVDPDTSGPPTPNLDAPKKKQLEAGGVAGFFGLGGHEEEKE